MPALFRHTLFAIFIFFFKVFRQKKCFFIVVVAAPRRRWCRHAAAAFEVFPLSSSRCALFCRHAVFTPCRAAFQLFRHTGFPSTDILSHIDIFFFAVWWRLPSLLIITIHFHAIRWYDMFPPFILVFLIDMLLRCWYAIIFSFRDDFHLRHTDTYYYCIFLAPPMPEYAFSYWYALCLLPFLLLLTLLFEI